MRTLAILLLLLCPASAASYTIDFEAASGFVVGEAPPATYATPWGEVRFFGDSIVAEDPLAPGEQMLSPVPGSRFFTVRVPPSSFPEFLLVNPAGDQMVVSYFDDGWECDSGDGCLSFNNDRGVTIPAESRLIFAPDAYGAELGSAGPQFYSGAHPDFDYSRDCEETPEGCFYGWGIASIRFTPEPGTGLLVSLGLVGLGARRRVRRRMRQNAHFSPS